MSGAGALVSGGLVLERASAADLPALIALQQAAYARNRDLLGVGPLPLLADFCTWANALSLDMVVEMGDRINNVDVDVDSRLTSDGLGGLVWTKERRYPS